MRLKRNISIHALREEGDTFGSTSGSIWTNFYPRPPRGGRRCKSGWRCGWSAISIHALREEGDVPRRLLLHARVGISIHALREEGDPGDGPHPCRSCAFLSTPSARRATTRFAGSRRLLGYFYPRPPRGGRPYHPHVHLMIAVFLSTPSARRATAGQVAGADALPNFYPRPPRGGRPLPSCWQ